jgi:hypothetical protein
VRSDVFEGVVCAAVSGATRLDRGKRRSSSLTPPQSRSSSTSLRLLLVLFARRDLGSSGEGNVVGGSVGVVRVGSRGVNGGGIGGDSVAFAVLLWAGRLHDKLMSC